MQGLFRFGLGYPKARGWRFVPNRLMRTQRVEMNAPLLNEHPRFAQAVEQLAVEPLISELAVKALPPASE